MTYPWVKVTDTGDGADSTDRHAREEPVALPGDGGELRRLVLSLDPSDLGDTTARQLHADDVLVRPELGEHLGVDVNAGGNAGEVVDHNRYRASVSQLYAIAPWSAITSPLSIENIMKWAIMNACCYHTSLKKSTTASSFMAKWKKLGVRTRAKSAPASEAAFVSAMTC